LRKNRNNYKNYKGKKEAELALGVKSQTVKNKSRAENKEIEEEPLIIEDKNIIPEVVEEEKNIPLPVEPEIKYKVERFYFKVKENKERGWDHGVFVPLMVALEKANIPLVQISLLSSLDPLQHLQLGQILYDLRNNDDCMVIGSGMTFHNFDVFFGDDDNSINKSKQFHSWLHDIFNNNKYNIYEKIQNIIEWKKVSPFGKYCHPREEHLIPLFVCFGSCIPSNIQLDSQNKKDDDNDNDNNKILIKTESISDEAMKAYISNFCFL